MSHIEFIGFSKMFTRFHLITTVNLLTRPRKQHRSLSRSLYSQFFVSLTHSSLGLKLFIFLGHRSIKISRFWKLVHIIRSVNEKLFISFSLCEGKKKNRIEKKSLFKNRLNITRWEYFDRKGQPRVDGSK